MHGHFAHPVKKFFYGSQIERSNHLKSADGLEVSDEDHEPNRNGVRRIGCRVASFISVSFYLLLSCVANPNNNQLQSISRNPLSHSNKVFVFPKFDYVSSPS